MNFNNIPYKKRNQWLVIGLLVFLMVIYMASIQPTMELWSANNQLEAQLNLAKTAPSGIKALEMKSRAWENQISHGQIGDTVAEQTLVEAVSGFCQRNRLLLKEYPGVFVEENNDFLIETNLLNIEGSYANILKLAYFLEYEEQLGRIASLRFETVQDRRTRRTSLEAALYLQNIKKTENGI